MSPRWASAWLLLAVLVVTGLYCGYCLAQLFEHQADRMVEKLG